MGEVSKKTGVILLLAAIAIAVIFVFFILNYIQTPVVVEGPMESDSSGEVTLSVTKPPEVKD